MAKRQRGNGEGAITQRADGRWMARVSLGGYGKSRRVESMYGVTRDQVAKALTNAFRARDTGKRSPGNPRLAVFAASWLTGAAAALKPSTREFYPDYLNHHVLPLLGRHRVDRVRRWHVVGLIRACRQKDLKLHPFAASCGRCPPPLSTPSSRSSSTQSGTERAGSTSDKAAAPSPNRTRSPRKTPIRSRRRPGSLPTVVSAGALWIAHRSPAGRIARARVG